MASQLLSSDRTEVHPRAESDNFTVDAITLGVYPVAIAVLRESSTFKLTVGFFTVDLGGVMYCKYFGYGIKVLLEWRVARHSQRVECCCAVIGHVTQFLPVKEVTECPPDVFVVVRAELT